MMISLNLCSSFYELLQYRKHFVFDEPQEKTILANRGFAYRQLTRGEL